MNSRKLKIGIVGAGQFSRHFIPLFQAHPNTQDVYITDLVSERTEKAKETYGIGVMDSFAAMLDSDLDAVAIFVQRHLHGPMTIQALKAGKHVYSAVPMGINVAECRDIIDLVAQTRLTYMMGETCYYFPCACFCREKYKAGDIGRFVYGESQYYHDIAGFDFRYTAGENWKKEAGIPPMFYPTHSFSMILSACDSHVERLAALGYEDQENDGIYGAGNNYWDNPFSNTASLCRLANGGMARVSEFRRIGTYKPSSYLSAFYGTRGAYEYSNAQHTFARKLYDDKEDVAFDDVSDYVNTVAMTENKDDPDFKAKVANNAWNWSTHAPVQPRDRLPQSFAAISDGHVGTHKFLVNDFMLAAASDRLPPCNAWFAARCNIPGFMAHESALKGGAMLVVPDLGDPPDDWPRLYAD